MEETINIKCPNDGALLKVRYRPGLENMSITCPVCRQKMLFSQMIKMESMERVEKGTQYPNMPQTPAESVTQYPQSISPQPMPNQMQQHIHQPASTSQPPHLQQPHIPQANPYTQNTKMPGCPPPLPNTSPKTAPRLRSTQFNQVYTLRVGANIIGRMAPNSSANIQLPASPLKRMSREHIKIEVRQNGNQYQAICSLFKPDCNATYVNGMPLTYGNTFILQHGAVLSLPDCEVVFEMY